ncbi:hypothetical protein B0H19DRAFT_593101 [Mycena capillaripes]|nr:hypothetical protein B0H19DRAFT_593101 [Mycena capillaripes]
MFEVGYDPLQWIPSPITDLVQIWEDYKYIAAFYLHRGNAEPSPSLLSQLVEQVTKCPLLLRILATIVLLDSSNFFHIHHILNLSWDEVRAAMSQLQTILDGYAKGVDLRKLILMLLQDSWWDTWRVDTSIDLSWGCIRLRRLIDAGHLPDRLWNPYMNYGRFIRGSPPCAALLSAVREFVLPCNFYQEIECHDVIQWLKSFPEPPLDEIRRWQNLFWEERQRSSERMGNKPITDYEERWRKWERRLDLNTPYEDIY